MQYLFTTPKPPALRAEAARLSSRPPSSAHTSVSLAITRGARVQREAVLLTERTKSTGRGGGTSSSATPSPALYSPPLASPSPSPSSSPAIPPAIPSTTVTPASTAPSSNAGFEALPPTDNVALSILILCQRFACPHDPPFLARFPTGALTTPLLSCAPRCTLHAAPCSLIPARSHARLHASYAGGVVLGMLVMLLSSLAHSPILVLARVCLVPRAVSTSFSTRQRSDAPDLGTESNAELNVADTRGVPPSISFVISH
ncbi:hypothetical protein DFH09DRAFT_1320410 [Mycena vulgaris]|nr:hypothetical protein DFH09DRAFT_1320410 [Mycena vulgaris]